ncbi:hypothetical protein ILUMI_02651, partial [Ignelater luminosus]
VVSVQRCGKSNDPPFVCTRCGKMYQVSTSLRRHMKYDCGRVKRPIVTGYSVTSAGYVCQACTRSYKGFASLKRHLKYECGKFPNIQCPVSGCNYKAKLNARMLQHVRMVHKLEYSVSTEILIRAQHPDRLSGKKEVRYCCSKCNKNYKHRKHLTSHLTYECGKEPQFQCEVCLKRAFSVFLPKMQQKLSAPTVAISTPKIRVWNGTKIWFFLQSRTSETHRFKCNGCTRSYKYLRSLKRHQKIECGKEKKFVCNYCLVRFYYKQDMEAHTIRKHLHLC